jgi:hypothetical protein
LSVSARAWPVDFTKSFMDSIGIRGKFVFRLPLIVPLLFIPRGRIAAGWSYGENF